MPGFSEIETASSSHNYSSSRTSQQQNNLILQDDQDDQFLSGLSEGEGEHNDHLSSLMPLWTKK